MNDYWYCLVSKALAVGGFVTLVGLDHPWWGLCCFIVMAYQPEKEIKQ